jgi:hypothetical protein
MTTDRRCCWRLEAPQIARTSGRRRTPRSGTYGCPSECGHLGAAGVGPAAIEVFAQVLTSYAGPPKPPRVHRIRPISCCAAPQNNDLVRRSAPPDVRYRHSRIRLLIAHRQANPTRMEFSGMTPGSQHPRKACGDEEAIQMRSTHACARAAGVSKQRADAFAEALRHIANSIKPTIVVRAARGRKPVPPFAPAQSRKIFRDFI